MLEKAMKTHFPCVIPQGSIIEPPLFIIYTTGASLVEFAAVIVSWRGIVCERSMAYLRGLGARKRLAKVLSVVVCEASYGCRVAYSHTA